MFRSKSATAAQAKANQKAALYKDFEAWLYDRWDLSTSKPLKYQA